jgi:hypothetical protein
MNLERNKVLANYDPAKLKDTLDRLAKANRERKKRRVKMTLPLAYGVLAFLIVLVVALVRAILSGG